MIWYVHRRDDGSIASAHQELQANYAEEALDDAKDGELQALLASAAPAQRRDPLVELDALRASLKIAKSIADINAAATVDVAAATEAVT